MGKFFISILLTIFVSSSCTLLERNYSSVKGLDYPNTLIKDYLNDAIERDIKTGLEIEFSGIEKIDLFTKLQKNFGGKFNKGYYQFNKKSGIKKWSIFYIRSDTSVIGQYIIVKNINDQIVGYKVITFSDFYEQNIEKNKIYNFATKEKLNSFIQTKDWTVNLTNRSNATNFFILQGKNKWKDSFVYFFWDKPQKKLIAGTYDFIDDEIAIQVKDKQTALGIIQSYLNGNKKLLAAGNILEGTSLGNITISYEDYNVLELKTSPIKFNKLGELKKLWNLFNKIKIKINPAQNSVQFNMDMLPDMNLYYHLSKFFTDNEYFIYQDFSVYNSRKGVFEEDELNDIKNFVANENLDGFISYLKNRSEAKDKSLYLDDPFLNNINRAEFRIFAMTHDFSYIEKAWKFCLALMEKSYQAAKL